MSAKVTLRPVVIPTDEKSLEALLKVMSLPAPAARVVAPVTAKAPLCVMAPLEVTPYVPVIVDAPKIMALASINDTLAPVTDTAPVKSLEVLVRVTSWPASDIEVVPVTVKAPDCVMAPPAVQLKLRPILCAPKITAFVSLNVASLPLVTTAVPKLLVAVLRVMSFVAPVDVNVAVPGTIKAPDWVRPAP